VWRSVVVNAYDVERGASGSTDFPTTTRFSPDPTSDNRDR